MSVKEIQHLEIAASARVRVVITAEANPASDNLTGKQRNLLRLEAERLHRDRNNERFRALRAREDTESDASVSRVVRQPALKDD